MSGKHAKQLKRRANCLLLYVACCDALLMLEHSEYWDRAWRRIEQWFAAKFKRPWYELRRCRNETGEAMDMESNEERVTMQENSPKLMIID